MVTLKTTRKKLPPNAGGSVEKEDYLCTHEIITPPETANSNSLKLTSRYCGQHVSCTKAELTSVFLQRTCSR
nr:MAG TPA: hypothetical protein [Caudoviricetes sp.]